MKKYVLREPFTLDFKNELHVGPKVLELDEKTAEMNKWKLEEQVEKPALKAKKEKA